MTDIHSKDTLCTRSGPATLATAKHGRCVQLGDGLLPCPFCGSPAERIDFGPGSGDNEGGSCVACTVCQHSGPIEFGYKENFISNWNRRALSAPPAQPVDLVPAAIPDTPEVRDILGRPNFWCSPWANILRKRGDVIPCKAEEEQAAVILFMLNHYLAHGAGWAETAEAELQAIRYQVARND